MSFFIAPPNPFNRLAAIIPLLAVSLLLQAQNRPARASQTQSQQRILRAIDDPFSGARWLLVSDPDHPGGPAILVSADRSTPPTGKGEVRPHPPVVLIRPGDRLLLEAHTTTTDTWLDAVALGPARAGSAFLARLSFGSSIVSGIATAPGRATLTSESKAPKEWAQ